jgi:energy-coupling factor transporter transmembrane protein EcfT
MTALPLSKIGLLHTAWHILCFKAVSVLQSASLCLTCTPAEELAVALRTLLRPFAIFRVPVNEIGECSGLSDAPHESLRCMFV